MKSQREGRKDKFQALLEGKLNFVVLRKVEEKKNFFNSEREKPEINEPMRRDKQ